jgi:hypothetical protein
MTHVGTVGQIVVPIEPGEQRVEIGCLQAGLAGHVEDGRLWIELFELRSDALEGLFPGRLDVAV